jgi:hypothetical protein
MSIGRLKFIQKPEQRRFLDPGFAHISPDAMWAADLPMPFDVVVIDFADLPLTKDDEQFRPASSQATAARKILCSSPRLCG